MKTLTEYSLRYPDNCSGCYTIINIYNLIYSIFYLEPESETGFDTRFDTLCIGVETKDYSFQCPCRKCLIKMKCKDKTCPEFLRFIESLESLESGI